MLAAAGLGLARNNRNTSLVFDIELEDGGVGTSWQQDDNEEDDAIASEVARFTAPCNAAEAKLAWDVHAALPHSANGQDLPRIAQILTALGYKVHIRTALGGGAGSDCLRNLRHTFLSISLPAATTACPEQQAEDHPGPRQMARRYIIDPQFKEQFVIAKATARFCGILAAVPSVLVASEERLFLLVNFLCTEMSTAFRQLNSVLPPWRAAASMLTKWKPRKCVEASVLAPTGLAIAAPTAARPSSSSTSQVPPPASSQLPVVHGLEDSRVQQLKGSSLATVGDIHSTSSVMQLAPYLQGKPPPAQLLAHSKSHAVLPKEGAGHGGRQATAQQPPPLTPPALYGVPLPSMPRPGADNVRRPCEPHRVYMGGNFVPINPTASARS